MKAIERILCFFGRHKWSETWRRFEYPVNFDGYIRVTQKVCLRHYCQQRSELKTWVQELL